MLTEKDFRSMSIDSLKKIYNDITPNNKTVSNIPDWENDTLQVLRMKVMTTYNIANNIVKTEE